MPRLPVLLLLLAITACASPDPRFTGPGREAVVGDYSFTVFTSAGQAQVFRTNRTFMPDTASVMAAAVLAVEQTTRCSVPLGQVRGDAALIRMPINC